MQLLAVSALTAATVGLTLLTARGRRHRRGTRRSVLVRVRSGYEPATICATAGEPIQLRFRRETFAASGGRVIFPALGRSIELPLFDEVTLELLLDPGRYKFTCEQGLLRGALEVDERRRPRALQSVQHANSPRARSAVLSHDVLSIRNRSADPCLRAPIARRKGRG